MGGTANNMDSAIAALKDSGEFDAEWYLSQYPDVRLLGMDPAEHFLWIGKRLGRKGSAHFTAGAPRSVVKSAAAKGDDIDSVMEFFMRETDSLAKDARNPVSNLMHYIWSSRLDLQAFDLSSAGGRKDYSIWFIMFADVEYGIKPSAFPRALLETFSEYEGSVGEKARRLLDASSVGEEVIVDHEKLQTGANLIGYACGEFGMGEHVRMVAECLDTSSWPFSIVNVPVGEGSMHSERDTRVQHWISDSIPFATNIFHVNADILPSLYLKFGAGLFSKRYNIGYWAWELANCPAEFDIAINMMDEVWGISEFVTESFRQRCSIPVVNMPLAVEIPPLKRVYSKEHFGAAKDEFLFLFMFDGASYLDRKNPLGVVRAFKQAFPKRSERVRLILKTMNVPQGNPLWDMLVREAAEDPRITILTTKLLRDEVLGLTAVCDTFVSLHRSEGFGRCMAEAMLWGKPVVATGYSGTSDFIRPDTACVVDCNLIPVARDAYPFWKGQEWADPDQEHAAIQMKRLVDDQVFRRNIAQAGQVFIRDNFNREIIGSRYAERLEQLQGKTLRQVISPVVAAANDEIRGNVDLPSTDPTVVSYGPNVSMEGWAVSRAGIEDIAVYHGDEDLGHAHLGILRPDVGQDHADMADAARSGFCLQVDTSKMKPGRQTLRIVVRSKSGREAEWLREFTLGDSEAVYQAWLGNNATKRDAGALLVSFVVSDVDSAQVNHAAVLRTVDALMGQRIGSFEVLVPENHAWAKELLDLARNHSAQHKPEFRLVAGSWRYAVKVASGEFVSLIDIGDVLDPRAVEALLINVEANPKIDFVYADEDLDAGDGLRKEPRFKPAWSPVLFRGYNYIGRPWFARTVHVNSSDISGQVSPVDSEYDLLRRALVASDVVSHVPSVLVSRCQRPQLQQREIPKDDDGPWPRVSVIMPCKLAHQEVIERCLKGLLEETDYPDLEVFVITSGSSDKMAAGTWLKNWPIKRLHWADGYFNWSAINNLGVRHATGDLLLFMNDDMAPLGPDWLKEMVRVSRQRDVGIVGAMLEYPNGRIQHAGIGLSQGAGFHVFRFLDPAEDRIGWLVRYDREVSAATGACILTRRECYDAVGGFDEELPIVCNDTDFGLRMWEKGYSSVVAASARLIHYEGISRAGLKESDDVIRFQARWREWITFGDPFFNPNLDILKGDWSVSGNAKGTLLCRSRSNKR
jgi:GT2 family glycosyltransferase/glycosyltransferase involved in cell wall biosynthesis